MSYTDVYEAATALLTEQETRDLNAIFLTYEVIFDNNPVKPYKEDCKGYGRDHRHSDLSSPQR